MVVILIIAILVAVAVPIYINATNNAKRRTCQANLRSIDGAVQVFRATTPTELYPILNMMFGYFKDDKVPKCPNGNASYEYAPSSDVSCVNSPDHTYP